MKKLISLVLFILLGFVSIGTFVSAEDNTYKYLNKSIIEKLDKKIDSIKGNKTRSLILLIGKVDKIIKSEKNETKKDIYSELNTYLKLKKKEYEISSSSLFVDDKKNNIEIKKVIFSQEQINEILKNIDKGINQQKGELVNSNTLIQGDFKAEYIASKDYTKDTDKIIVTISGKKYELSGVYGEEQKQKYLTSIKNGGCFSYGKLTEPSDGDCMVSLKFNNFISFSPSGYCILYNVSGYANSEDRLVNIETGKNYLNTCGGRQPSIWTNDKKQFIYSDGFGMGCDNGGLYITIKGDFPNSKKISDYETVGLFVDDNYIYTTILISNDRTSYNYNKLLIYDLNTLELVYSQDVDSKD